jgi:hypothetical protein
LRHHLWLTQPPVRSARQPAAASGCAACERETNRALCDAYTAAELLHVVAQRGMDALTPVNVVTALHRLAKVRALCHALVAAAAVALELAFVLWLCRARRPAGRRLCVCVSACLSACLPVCP